MKLLDRLAAYRQVIPKASRNRSDLVRYLVRRPLIALGIGTYEATALLSNRVDARTKGLAALRASSMIGCPF